MKAMNKKLTPVLFSASALLMSVGTADAAFVLQDDFESYNVGVLAGQGDWVGNTIYSVASGVSDGDGGTTQAVQFPVDAGAGPGGNEVIRTSFSESIGTAGTVFFQYRTQTTSNFGNGIGVTDVDIVNAGFGDQVAYPSVISDTELAARDGGNATNVTISDELTGDTWHNVWMVLDDVTDTYDVYVSSGRDNIATPTTSVTGLEFRRTPAGAIDTFYFFNFQSGDLETEMYVDNIYLDASAENLSNPIPEPASLALVGAGAALMMFRRKRTV